MGLYPPLMPGHSAVAFYSIFHMVPNYDSYIVAWTADRELRSQKTVSLHHTQKKCVLCLSHHMLITVRLRTASHSHNWVLMCHSLEEGTAQTDVILLAVVHFFFSSYILVFSAIPPPPYPVWFFIWHTWQQCSLTVASQCKICFTSGQIIGFSELHSQLLCTPHILVFLFMR